MMTRGNEKKSHPKDRSIWGRGGKLGLKRWSTTKPFWEKKIKKHGYLNHKQWNGNQCKTGEIGARSHRRKRPPLQKKPGSLQLSESQHRNQKAYVNKRTPKQGC